MKTLVVAIALGISAASVALAADQQPSPPTAAPTDAAHLANIGRIGHTLYALDRVGWISTDTMQHKLSKARQQEVRGWIVEPSGDRMSALYYGLKDGAPYGVFVVEFVQGKVTSTREVDRGDASLTPVQHRMIGARQAVAPLKIEGCGTPFNTVVMPPANETAPVHVYLLTPQTKTGFFPAGRHLRMTAHADGSFSARPFTNSCLTIGSPPLKAGEKPVGMYVTHVLDQTPTEIHVWLSMHARMPVYVGTAEPKQIWRVDGVDIRRVGGFGQ